MPKVSVLMPVYKTNEQYLREAIESILNQTYTDFEFLILDDCPTDTRESVVKSYNDERIKYQINEKNMGITPSRNKLIDMAQGEYLAVFDHDDISLPDRFENQVKYLDNHKEVGVVGSVYEIMNDRKTFSNLPETNEDIEKLLMQGCAVLHPVSMIRKSVLLDNNIRYEECFSPSEDYALWCRLIGKTKFYNIQKPLFRYRKHKTQTSNVKNKQMKEIKNKIWAFVRSEHPDIWAKVQENAMFIIRPKLFGIIPLGKIKQRGINPQGLLKYCPFVTFNAKLVV